MGDQNVYPGGENRLQGFLSRRIVRSISAREFFNSYVCSRHLSFQSIPLFGIKVSRDRIIRELMQLPHTR